MNFPPCTCFVRRLIVFVVFSFLSLFTFPSHAEFSKPTAGGWSCAAAFASYAASYPSASMSSCTLRAGQTSFCDAVITGVFAQPHTQGLSCTPIPGQCPANSTETPASTCACNSGYSESGNPVSCVANDPLDFGNGQCVANAEKVNGVCQCKAGFSQGSGTGGGCWPTPASDNEKCESTYAVSKSTLGIPYTHVSTSGDAISSGISPLDYCSSMNPDETPLSPGKGCKARATAQKTYTAADGKVYTDWVKELLPGSSNSCSLAQPAPSDSSPFKVTVTLGLQNTPASCKGYYGEVNGQPRCVPYSPSSSTTTSVVSATSTTSSSDGSPTTSNTTSITTCSGAGSCTTQTTVSTSVNGGAPTSVVTSLTQSKTQFCAQNPNSVQCGATSLSPGNSEGDSDSGSIRDTPMPGIPVLYEAKYADGVTGVWNSKISEIKALPLFTLAPSLMPSVGNNGSVPVWTLNLNFSSWANFGSHEISAPAWVWSFGKTVIILSALFLARSLIFGG